MSIDELVRRIADECGASKPVEAVRLVSEFLDDMGKSFAAAELRAHIMEVMEVEHD
jgi:hypothetical protein